MVQQVKLPFAILASQIRVLATLPLILLPPNVPGKAAEDGSNTWVPTTWVGDPDEVLGFWFWPSPDLVIAVI